MMMEILKIKIKIKASCHINGHVTVTAVKYGEQNNHVKIARTCVMPQDQIPGVDICMSGRTFFAHNTLKRKI